MLEHRHALYIFNYPDARLSFLPAALLAEYTTIGSIFTSYVGSVPYPMVIVVGVLTAAYTAYGGLLVSIYTDQIQGIVSLLFFFLLAIYMAAAFRPEVGRKNCELLVSMRIQLCSRNWDRAMQ